MIYVCAPQRGKPDIQKNKFYDELVCKWDMKDTKELTGDHCFLSDADHQYCYSTNKESMNILYTFCTDQVRMLTS